MHKTLDDYVGGTPLVRLKRLPGAPGEARGNRILGQAGRQQPGRVGQGSPGAVDDRARRAARRHPPGDTLIEATSGNTGIALAMVAAARGYRMILVMPENQSVERRQTMRAFGAELVLTPKDGGMELARDVAERHARRRSRHHPRPVRQPDNPLAHYEGTGPELWRRPPGEITHFVSSMGTTGTIMGVSRYLKEQNPGICIVGCQPEDGSQIPGIRKWPEAYLPKIFDRSRSIASNPVADRGGGNDPAPGARRRHFAGISSGGSLVVALRLAASRERDHRQHRLRPRRPLSVDRRLSRLNAMKPVLAFDIETIPDVEGLRRLHGLDTALSDDEVAELAFQQRRARAATISCRCTCSASR
jgi:cysteine synthase B